MDMQLIFPGHTVDLRDRIMLIQYLCDLRQTAWRCFDLKIAGYRSADLLGIDNGCVFLDNALLPRACIRAFTATLEIPILSPISE